MNFSDKELLAFWDKFERQYYEMAIHPSANLVVKIPDHDKECLDEIRRRIQRPKVSIKWIRAIVTKEFYAPTINRRIAGWMKAFKDAGFEVEP